TGLASASYVLAMLWLAVNCMNRVRAGEASEGFDVSPFALPGGPSGEIRFEETRDVAAVDVILDGPQSASLGRSSLHDNWPRTKLDRAKDMTQPTQSGGTKVDDWFNGHWKRAKPTIESLPDGWLRISFEPLSTEFPEEEGYYVRFRRTLGLRIEGVK